ncbi:proteinase inhibitor, propeptide [Peziza echinospora]|nr:proteinase inhibitor, propeptide [Peziza echinospora]
MSSYIVTFRADTTDSEIQKIKDEITGKGCTIEHEYTLIKGFSFSKPEVSTFAVHALSDNPAVENVEADQIVTTQ